MLTPSQLHDLITNATQRNLSQWAIKLRVNRNRLAGYVLKHGIRCKVSQAKKAIDLEQLRNEATTRTHQEWASYFGVSKERMYVVCSNNNIKVKNSYGQIPPPR